MKYNIKKFKFCPKCGHKLGLKKLHGKRRIGLPRVKYQKNWLLRTTAKRLEIGKS